MKRTSLACVSSQHAEDPSILHSLTGCKDYRITGAKICANFEHTYLNTVVARGHASVLNFDVCRRMCELALGVRAGTFVALVLPAYLQLQPARILAVQ